MGELPLPEDAMNREAETYRFTCLRTFHRPFSIRVSKTGERYKLQRTVLTGKGGYQPGEIEASHASDLSQDKVKALRTLIEEVGILNMSPFGERGGEDGSVWILEVVKDGKCFYLERWTPNGSTPLRRVGEWLLKEAQWHPKELY